jgi:DNA repair protein RecO (recombination protein O)
MRVSDRAIILQAIKYGDKKFILKLYTRHNGLLTAAAQGGSSPSSKIRTSLLQPLNMLEIELMKKQNRDVQRLTEASCYYVSHPTGVSISRLGIAQFMNEILLRCLKEQSANGHLYDFIESCLRYLNESEEFINLHIYFMTELSKYLGIEPHNNYSKEQPYFDMREGRFTEVSLVFPLGLNEEESRFFSEMLRCDLLAEKMNNSQRQKLVEILLAYYQLHVPGFGNIRSLEVLRDVMG